MKDLKISKELLSEVLNYEVDAFLGINKNEIDYTCCRDENEGYVDISINIYEFAYKSKEWAENKGYILFSKNKECLIYSIDEVYDVIECLNQYEDYFEGNTEIEAVIKACNWILEELNERFEDKQRAN